MKRILGIFVLVVGLSGSIWWFRDELLGGNPAQQPERPPFGQDQPREGCWFENGFNVCNYGDDAKLKDFYLKYADVLGEPVGGFDSRCQPFRFNKICFNPANPPAWKVEFANTGLLDLQANGLTPQPGAELHPAVRGWLIGQLEVGLDTNRVIGRVISPPVCEKGAARCRQWTDKALFLFSPESTSAAQVQRAPLGLWSVPRPATEQTPGIPYPVAGALALIAVVGIVLLIHGRGSRQPVTI